MKAQRSVPKWMTTVEILMLLLVACGLAPAATKTANCTSIDQSIDLANAIITCSQFNPKDGELTSVAITITGGISGSITLGNGANIPETFDAITQTVFRLNAAVPGFNFPTPLFVGPAFDTGVQALEPGAGFTFGD